MSSSDRPKRPSARPSARPPSPAGDRADERGARSNPPPAGAGARSGQQAAKANATRVSARRGAGAPEPAAAKAQTRGDAPEPRRPVPPAAREQAPAGKSRKARKRARDRGASVPPAPVAPAPASSRPHTTNGLSAPPTIASHDDGDDVFSAADLHTELVAGLNLGAGKEDDDPETPALSRLTRSSSSDRRAQEAALKGAQSLLSSDYYVRQYGAHGMRSLSADVDEYGLDPHVEERARPWLEMLCTRYFRLDLEGARRIPSEGRALLVANRSGSVPWDGLMLHTALRMQRPELQPVRWLSEDSVIHYPFLGVFMNRLGAVRACPENAERLLSQDRLVAVFPEGAQGSQKLFKDRYRLQRFGRGGYVKLALKLGAPILPTAIIGAEETNPLLARLKLFGRASGDDYLPITPTFPWLGPAGLLPAPIKWRVIVGEPVDLSAYGPEAAEDALVVHRLNEQIRSILQALLDQGTASRRSVLFG